MNSIVKNSAHLLSANVIAQVIGLIVYPILTRLYTPEDFGLLNLFLSIGGILTMVAVAEYYYAIVLPKDNSRANGIVQICSFMLLIMVGLVALTIPFAKCIAGLFNTPSLADYWWLMPFFIGLTGAWNIFNYWYIRCSEFKRISGYQISQSVLSSGCKMVLGYAGFLQGGLIVSMVIAPLVSLFVSVSISWRKCLHNLHFVPWSICKEVANEYKNFPLFILPKSFINLFVGYLPVLVLTPYFGSYQVGLWTMALLLGFTPISMITRAVYQVMYEQVSLLVKRSESILPLFKSFTYWIIGLTTPVFVGLFFILPWLVSIFLGEQWITSGEYIRWMLPWLIVSLLTSSTGFVADIFFEQKKSLYFEILLAVLRIAGVGIGLWLNRFVIAIIGYCIGSAVANLAQYIWLFSLVVRYEKGK